jgi:hypothetical protein
MFSRYDFVLLSTLLDTMEDVLYCPRPACHYPVAVEPGEKMAACPSCSYVFCIYCKMVYHGIEPCRFRSREHSYHKCTTRLLILVSPTLSFTVFHHCCNELQQNSNLVFLNLEKSCI